MQTLILPDWNYPLNRRRMTDAERWTAEYGFTRGTEFVNRAGQKLAELLDAEPTATESGTVYPRWTFPDGSAVVLGQCTWRVE
jgi:hypothetical protein